MVVDLNKPDRESVRKAAFVIRRGGILLYPADTTYGLGCDPFNSEAVNRLFAVKKRPKVKGMLVLVPSPSWIDRLSDGTANRASVALQTRFWPGPLTLVLPANPELPEALVGEQGQIGVRWPEGLFLKMLLNEIPGPLVSTSANISGRKMYSSVSEMRSLFEAEVDLIVEGLGFVPGAPSTVVDVSSDNPRIVRRGIQAADVESFLQNWVSG